MLHREMLINGHFIGGPCDQAVPKSVVKAPYDGHVIGSYAEGGWVELRAAMESAHEAFQSWRTAPRHKRQSLLRRIATLTRERSEELSDLLTDEVGKPITWSRAEVARMGLTFDYAADLLTTWGTESLPVDMDPRGDGHTCRVERFPVGVVFGIVPYNWPFNLAAHKLAPALATGNTIVIKPSGQAALSTLTLARLIHEAGCPPGVVNAVACDPEVAEKGIKDERAKMLSFTGSPAVGWKLKGLVPEKKVSLELGGNASAIVCEDAELSWAIPRIILGGYGYAGQICISIQHVLVHETIYDEVREQLIEQTRSCPTGHPRDAKTVCGPLISSDAADKVQEWIREAQAMGGTLLAGGERNGNVIKPTLMENVPEGARLASQEVFGPVMTLQKFRSMDEAIGLANKSEFGIHTGVFTHDLRYTEHAFKNLHVGGVIVNDYPTLRFDNMPYGGVKRSGFGREGLRYAMDEMTEPKTLVIRAV